MRAFFLVIAVVIFLVSCIFTLLLYPVRFHFLYDENERFTVNASFLFFRFRITGPLALRERCLSDKAFRKRIQRKQTKRRTKESHFISDSAEALSEKRDGLRLIFLTIKTLKNEEYPRLGLTVRRLELHLAGEEPDRVAVLTGAVSFVFSALFEFLSSAARIYYPKTASVGVFPAFFSEKSAFFFDAVLKIPLLYYLETFGFHVPDRKYMLLCLEKRQEKQRRQAHAAMKRREKGYVGE